MENRLLDTVGEGEGGMIRESSTEVYILHMQNTYPVVIHCKEEGTQSQWSCDNPEGWDGEGGLKEVQEGGLWLIHLWLIHANAWQKPSQYCKAIILQSKKKKSSCRRKIKKRLTQEAYIVLILQLLNLQDWLLISSWKKTSEPLIHAA